jgi:CHAT domain-containing protein
MFITPGEIELPGMLKEISKIKTAMTSVFFSNTLIHFNAEIVLNRLNRYNTIYFACYGASNYIDPFDNFLIFQKNTFTRPITDKLTVRQIIDTYFKRATIAYLSACLTAENRVSILQNEIIYLASGFQIAGFSYVIASIWLSNDEVCVKMAKNFYTRLGQNDDKSPNKRGITKAVHDSTLEIRSKLRAIPLN